MILFQILVMMFSLMRQKSNSRMISLMDNQILLMWNLIQIVRTRSQIRYISIYSVIDY